jgi:hypothetical protein
VQEGGERNRSKMPSSQDHAILGFLVGAFVGFFITSNWIGALVGAIAGTLLLYHASRTRFELSNLLRKLLATFLVFYGLFAELSPSKYPLGNIPESQIPVVALAMILVGIYLLRHELGLA